MKGDIIKKNRVENEDVAIYQDPALLSEFLKQPTLKIAEAITGLLSQGRPGLMASAGRIIQGAIKGKMMEQVGREIKKLIDEGKIKEDYAESKFGFKSLAELLDFIDSETPDNDRFEAIKAVFYYINSKDAISSEEVLNYQIFQIIKKLTSSQIILLKLCYTDYLEYLENPSSPVDTSAVVWLNHICQIAGHNIVEIIEKDEYILIENSLLTKRQYPDRSGTSRVNGRLTGLGIKVSEYINFKI